MNHRDKVKELALDFVGLDPRERLIFLRYWFTKLVNAKGDRGRKLLYRFYLRLEDLYLDSDGKLSEWIRRKLEEDIEFTPVELAHEAYRVKRLRQADIPYLIDRIRRVKRTLLTSRRRRLERR